MEPSNHGVLLRKDSVTQVRHQLLTGLHIGRLIPGGRAPSVRRLADITGLNRKTVHRAYTRLAQEGMLDLRPGSGTFISESINSEAADPGAASITALLDAAESCGAIARSLRLPPERFTTFLDYYLGQGYRSVPMIVT